VKIPTDVKGRKCRHIQSYFLVIKKNIFTTSDFINFMEHIRAEEKKNDVVQKYEVGLSQMLLKKDFVAKSYIHKYQKYGNPTVFAWRELMEERLSPLVKCSLFRLQNTRDTIVEGWESEFENYSYDVNLIKNNLKRLKIRPKNSYVTSGKC
jgi:lipopolysaccharide biosynthesis protein